MKYFLFFFLFAVSLFAADTILISDQLTVSLNGMVSGSAQDTMANYPEKKAAIENAVSEKIWSVIDNEPVRAKKLSDKAISQNVSLSDQLLTAVKDANP